VGEQVVDWSHYAYPVGNELKSLAGVGKRFGFAVEEAARCGGNREV
jgi:hypothetical protein